MVEQRKYDIVVFGATGFTGKYVVEEVARTISEENNLKWAIAGRQMKKLQEVLKVASKETGHDLTELPIIIADVSSEESLASMCQQTKVLLNCVGPYRLYGTPVVQACISSGTHHVDICGETEWLEKIQLHLNKDAQDKEVYVVQACGFDSIPAEMGVLYTKKQFKGELNSLEAFVSIKGGPFNDGTWRSAIHSLSHYSELKSVRERLYPQSFPKPKFKLLKRSIVFFSKEVQRWCLPFMGSDKAIVNRTNYYNYIYKKEDPVQFQNYFALSGIGELISWFFVALILGTFSKTRLGVYLLETFPRVFSLGKFISGGPTRKQVHDGSFSITFLGQGYSDEKVEVPDQKITTRVAGPEAGYITTPICCVQAAYVLLKEKDSLPDTYGVLTPGRAFSQTTLLERLQKRNITFSIL